MCGVQVSMKHLTGIRIQIVEEMVTLEILVGHRTKRGGKGPLVESISWQTSHKKPWGSYPTKGNITQKSYRL